MDIFSEKRILTVSQLTNLVTGVLEENFDHVWVEGEVSNFSTPTSGHLYFTLKDLNSQIRSVMFKGSARNLKFRINDGMHLIVRGRVSVFAQRGEYQLVAEYMEPKGVGALQLAFMQLKERLHKEGLFSESRKKPIPRLPKVVGIVTSPTGAAIHDIFNVIERRFSNIHILLRPVKVQGVGAAEEIASAIGDFNKYGKVDVLIIGRGGGAIEDLWAFNEEVVARAIAESKIPIISAVGHEMDITISDLAADLRAPTPSAAAELVIASKSELSEALSVQIHRLNRAAALKLKEARRESHSLINRLKEPATLIGNISQRLDHLQEKLYSASAIIIDTRVRYFESKTARLSAKNPLIAVDVYRERLNILCLGYERAVTGRIDRFKESVAISGTALQKLSPLATLGRGYSMACRSSDGLLVTNIGQIDKGDRIDLSFATGRARCIVEEKLVE